MTAAFKCHPLTLTREERQAIRFEHEQVFPGLANKCRMTLKQQAEDLAEHKRVLDRNADIRNS